MVIELTIGTIIAIIICSFLFEYTDATLGMGYGTTLTPVLLIFGFKPLEIIPAVLLSQLISSLLAAFFHHREGNVDLKPTTINPKMIIRKLRSLGYIESLKQGLPRHLKIALLLALCGIVGTIAAVFVAINISKFWLNVYIGCVVFLMGMLILITLNKEFRFSKGKIIVLGLIASFNKGMSGGGYGPIVTAGQILSGVEGKNAVGITALAEGLTCAVGVVTYLLTAKHALDWSLAPYVIIGAVCSVPFCAVSVKKLNTKKLKLAIAALTITLGIATLIKAFMP